jgi:uncharacterized protein YndB with AHSA1/START domain
MAELAPFGTGGFTTTRVFDAPRERVWREWTEPERFADWFGGAQCEGEYREVAAPERLIFTITDQPGDDRYELVTVKLTDLGDDRTEMHFEQRGHLHPDQYDYTRKGWGAFFARLDERLADRTWEESRK